MAAVENLEIIVDVDISDAIASLEELKRELSSLATDINELDARGTEGIDINTNVEPIADDLAAMRAQMAAMDGTDLFSNRDLEAMRGVVRDAIGDAAASGIANASESVESAVSGDERRGFNRPFMAVGSRAAARADRTGAAMTRMFGDDGRSGLLQRLRGQLSDSFNNLQQSISNMNISMSDLHNALARLLPLIGVFVGALPAAIAGVYGLAAAAVTAAAALGAIGAFGALGVALEDGQFQMENLTEVFDRIRNSFIDAFSPLAEELEPLFMEGVRGLERLFEQIAAEEGALLQLRDEARAFGGFVIDFVPDALATLGGFVEAMAPLLAEIGRAIDREFASMVMTLARVTQEAVPALAQMALIIGRAIPAIIRMSTGFAAMASIIMRLIGAYGQLLSLVGIMPEHFGFLVAAVLSAATAFFILNSEVGTFIALQFAKLGRAILAGITYLTRLSVTAVSTASTIQLVTFSLVGLIGALGIIAGLSAVVGGIGSQFAGLKTNVDAATKSLEEFQSVQEGLGSGMDGRNPYEFETPSQFTGPNGRTASSPDTVVINGDGDSETDSNARTDAWRRGRFTSSSR